MARDDEQQAMSEARLAEIRQRVECTDEPVIYWNGMSGALEQAEEDRAALLAEVERRQAREAALVASMRKLLEIADLAQYYSPGELGEFPGEVDRDIKQARALLASTGEAGEQAAQGEMFDCPCCGGRWRRDELGPTPDILRCPFCGEFCEPHEQAQGEAI